MGDSEFDTWLSERFRELNTDETVFVPYIKSIVEGDETHEEKIEALDGILAELAQADGNLDVESFRTDILSRWKQQQKKSGSTAVLSGDASAELDSKMERLLKLSDNLTSSSSQAGDKTGKLLGTQVPDSTLRAAILSQCQDSSENESDDEGPASSYTGAAGVSGVERNTNAERVQNELKDKREKEKAEAAKKREKDKEDRAKQKQQAQERKDKAKKKAAKVERKR